MNQKHVPSYTDIEGARYSHRAICPRSETPAAWEWPPLSRKGIIRQLARGLYEYPIDHPSFGRIPPSADAVAKALAKRDASRLQPTGAYAANILGLSDQVPTRIIFLTDGPSRRVKFGQQEIVLKRTTPRNMATAGRKSGTIIQALRHIGQHNINDRTLAILKRQLTKQDRAQLLKDLRYAPGWTAEIMRKLSAPDPHWSGAL